MVHRDTSRLVLQRHRQTEDEDRAWRSDTPWQTFCVLFCRLFHEETAVFISEASGCRTKRSLCLKRLIEASVTSSWTFRVSHSPCLEGGCSPVRLLHHPPFLISLSWKVSLRVSVSAQPPSIFTSTAEKCSCKPAVWRKYHLHFLTYEHIWSSSVLTEHLHSNRFYPAPLTLFKAASQTLNVCSLTCTVHLTCTSCSWGGRTLLFHLIDLPPHRCVWQHQHKSCILLCDSVCWCKKKRNLLVCRDWNTFIILNFGAFHVCHATSGVRAFTFMTRCSTGKTTRTFNALFPHMITDIRPLVFNARKCIEMPPQTGERS